VDDGNVHTIIDELRRTLKLPLQQHSKDDLLSSLQKGLPNFVTSIRTHIRLPCQVRLLPVDKPSGTRKSVASVNIPRRLPIIGTDEFYRTQFTVYISNSYLFNAKPTALAFTVAHELAHILLHATKSKLAFSERATEICAMMLGSDHLVFDAYAYTEKTVKHVNPAWWKWLFGVSSKRVVVVNNYYSPYLTLEEYARVAEEVAMIRVLSCLFSRTP